MERSQRLRMLFVAGVIGALGGVMPMHAQAQALPTGIVYVEANDPTPGGNAVLGYRRDAAGRLTALPGSPFRTGGRGTVTPDIANGAFDSDQNLVIDRGRRLLFAVNGGSNTIAVFRIDATGALTAVPGSPFPSGGPNPVALGLRGGRLIVVNKDADLAQPTSAGRPSYVAMRIGADGRLTPEAGARILLPEGVSPTQPLTAGTGSFAFGTQFPVAGVVDALQIADGAFRLLSSTTVPSHPGAVTRRERQPLGLWAHPSRPLLYLGLPVAQRLAVERWDPAGRLTLVGSAPNSGRAICWLVGNRAATRLYSSNTGSRSISTYDLTDPERPVELGAALTLRGVGLPFQLALDRTERFLYVVAKRVSTQPPEANALHVIAVGSDGRLSELAGSPLRLPVPAGARPQGVAPL